MLSCTWTSIGLLILGVKGSLSDDMWAHSRGAVANSTTYKAHGPHLTSLGSTTSCDRTSTIETVKFTVTGTETSTATAWVTVSNSTTLHYTITVIDTALATITNTETKSTTITNTETDSATITNTETDSAAITNTDTTTTTVPATVTTFSTQTQIFTTVDPCPTTCSLSVGTVNLFFWPTDRPYTYPSTYVDLNLAYTFTSPSVYMLIPTAVGTNSLGHVGPSTTDWILPLQLDEVSTIVDGSITSQLVLSDLGTDCPSTADPTAIATMVDRRCDPILAAPKEVSSWASPCNACGRFGLFDPPYAIPTITGGLLGTTTAATPTTATTATPAPVITTAAPAPTTSSAVAAPTEVPSSTYTASESSDAATSTAASASTTVAGSSSAAATSTAASTSPAAAASAARATGGLAVLISSIFVGALLL